MSVQGQIGRCGMSALGVRSPPNFRTLIGAAGTAEKCQFFFSITSAARAIRVGGRLMPSACAVLRLTTNSKCVGNWSGMFAGRAPRKTWTTEIGGSFADRALIGAI